MTDIVDMATTIAAEHLARSLAGIARDIPAGVAGVAGECDECGEAMPRLIDGRCGFCRDGRTPPASFFDRPAPVAIPFAPQQEPVIMPATTPMPSRKITFEGLALQAIEARSDADETSFKQAAEDLVLLAVDRATKSVPTTPMSGGVLSVCDTDELLDELRARFDAAAATPDLQRDLTEMTDRAIAAEARLTKIESAFRGDVS